MSKAQGYSLMELLIVVSIMLILNYISGMGWARAHDRHRLTSTKHQIVARLNYARQYAILHGETVIVCGSQNHRHCDGHWQSQWLLIGAGKIRHQWPLLAPTVQIQWRGSFGRRHQVQFNALGYASGSHGRFVLSDHRGHHKTELIISPSGLIR